MKFFYSILLALVTLSASAQFSTTNVNLLPYATRIANSDYILVNQKSGTSYLLKRILVNNVLLPMDTTNVTQFLGDCAPFAGLLTNTVTGGSLTIADGNVMFNQRAGFNGTNFWQYSDDGTGKFTLHVASDGTATWTGTMQSNNSGGGSGSITISGAGTGGFNVTLDQNPGYTEGGLFLAWGNNTSGPFLRLYTDGSIYFFYDGMNHPYYSGTIGTAPASASDISSATFSGGDASEPFPTIIYNP